MAARVMTRGPMMLLNVAVALPFEGQAPHRPSRGVNLHAARGTPHHSTRGPGVKQQHWTGRPREHTVAQPPRLRGARKLNTSEHTRRHKSCTICPRSPRHTVGVRRQGRPHGTGDSRKKSGGSRAQSRPTTPLGPPRAPLAPRCWQGQGPCSAGVSEWSH